MLNHPTFGRMFAPRVTRPARRHVLRTLWSLGIGALLFTRSPNAAAQVARFDVLRADEVVGYVIASRSNRAGTEVYAMESHCEVALLWKYVVRTALRTEYLQGELAACHTSVRVNDAVRDSSSMVRGRTDCYVHPDAPFDCARSTQWTTSRLYFEEPAGQSIIFVESVLQDCTLRLTAPGTYTLTLPNGHENHYVYRDGALYEIRVERPLMDLVFRRA